MSRDLIAGIDIGGTKIALALARSEAEIVVREVFSTEAATPEQVMGRAFASLSRLAEDHSGRLKAVGIACPGPLDFERGRFLAPPNMPPSWHRFPIKAFTESNIGVPAVIENDANAAAIGEHLRGAGRGFSDIVYLTISTGIGGGIIADNQLVHRSSEPGHVTVNPGGALCGCGARGCLEAECSGSGIARRAQEYLRSGRRSILSGVNQVTAKAVKEAVEQGDELALEVWRETISLMATGIAGIVAVLAPQAVILGGGVAANAGELLLAPLREELRQKVRIVPQPQILVAGLGTESGLYGAIALASRAV
jgi:glucokinase